MRPTHTSQFMPTRYFQMYEPLEIADHMRLFRSFFENRATDDGAVSLRRVQVDSASRERLHRGLGLRLGSSAPPRAHRQRIPLRALEYSSAPIFLPAATTAWPWTFFVSPGRISCRSPARATS
jgi:hypothetical protein